jgi:hypothetical protein
VLPNSASGNWALRSVRSSAGWFGIIGKLLNALPGTIEISSGGILWRANRYLRPSSSLHLPWATIRRTEFRPTSSLPSRPGLTWTLLVSADTDAYEFLISSGDAPSVQQALGDQQ